MSDMAPDNLGLADGWLPDWWWGLFGLLRPASHPTTWPRRAAPSRIKQEQTETGSQRRKRPRARWNDNYLEKLSACVS